MRVTRTGVREYFITLLILSLFLPYAVSPLVCSITPGTDGNSGKSSGATVSSALLHIYILKYLVLAASGEDDGRDENASTGFIVRKKNAVLRQQAADSRGPANRLSDGTKALPHPELLLVSPCANEHVAPCEGFHHLYSGLSPPPPFQGSSLLLFGYYPDNIATKGGIYGFIRQSLWQEEGTASA